MTFARYATPEPSATADRVVLIGGGSATIDILRLATIRSDEVVLVAPALDAATARYADRFAVERRARPAVENDLIDAGAVLVALDDLDGENHIVRAARRRHVPVFVSGRPLVSDFTLLEFLERRPAALAT